MRWVLVGSCSSPRTGAGLLALDQAVGATDPPDDKPVVEAKPKIEPAGRRDDDHGRPRRPADAGRRAFRRWR